GDVSPRGSLKQTVLRGNNMFASSDAWAAPVAARVGPDGAVWVADWYNPIIQHNVVFRFWNPARNYDKPSSPFHTGDTKPGKGNAYETPLRDREHGRIWRVTPAKAELRKRAEYALDPSKPASLAKGLTSPSQHVRLHAQRLLVERGGQDAVKPLSMLINENVAPEGSSKPLAAVHAIWTLQGLGTKQGTPSYQVLVSALGNSSELVRRHAMLALGGSDAAVLQAIPAMLEKTKDAREQLFILTTIAQGVPNQPVAAALWKYVSTVADPDDTLKEASRLAMRRQAVSLLSADFGNYDQGTWYGREVVEVIDRVASSPNRPALTALENTASESIRPLIKDALAKAPTTEPTEEPLPEHLTAGRDAYMKHCIECHQADGAGVAGTFPPLDGSEWVSGNPRTLLRIMLGGLAGPIEVKGVKYESIMPGHSHMPDEEIAAIASYVRHAYGAKREKPFPADQVKALRPEVEKRMFSPWTVDELKKLEK
ncbi:MAG: c-type cytochrome, partial [Verrucomicrobiaceae bacterium]